MYYVPGLLGVDPVQGTVGELNVCGQNEWN